MEKNESYLDVGHELRCLAARAYPKVPYQVREELVKEQFIQSLDVDMRRQIHLAHPPSLESAITLAIEYETVSISAKKIPSKPNIVAVVTQDASPATETLLTTLLEEIRSLKDRPSSGGVRICRRCNIKHNYGKCSMIKCYQ